MPPVSVHPEADLESRPNAKEPTQEELLQLELFQQLRKKPDIKKFPQSMVIRRIAKGEVICRQGESGTSAFYILTTDDVLRLKTHQLEQVRKELSEFESEKSDDPQITLLRKLQEEYHDEISKFEQRKANQETAQATGSDGETSPSMATAYLLVDTPETHASDRGGFLGKIRRLFASGNGDASKRPEYISIDGPSDIDYVKRTAPMFGGDIFGEMSCLTFAPRSATILADDDCYMLEFLRSIFDQIQRDASYKERTEEIYRKRVLATQFCRMEFFSHIKPEELDFVRENAHLEIVKPGTVICEEGDEADCVYLIRSGLVQIVKNANVSLSMEDIVDWPKFCMTLLKSGAKDAKNLSPDAVGDESASDTVKTIPIKAVKKEAAAKASPLDALKSKAVKPSVSPPKKVWQTLSDKCQEVVRRLTEVKSYEETEKRLILDDLNRMIRDATFVTSSDLKELRDSHEALAQVRAFGKAEKHWTDLDTRVAGRLLLEAIYPDCIRSHSRHGKMPRIVAYLSRGDIFGEMGVVDDEQSKRTATVIAYDHPDDGSGRRLSRLEIVRIDKAVFRELLDRSPESRRKIKEEVELRRQNQKKIVSQQTWETDILIESSEFRDMGFAQGQQMLLIDLDRCTRCGDCVRACINTHDDGYTRLFLDGPRFDRFLVPSACRNCRNPSCMIGCPVGSIQRGDDGEIQIRDWCIGCGICAKQCPYDSIQMHDTGLVPENAVGWRYTAEAAVGKNPRWKSSGYSADGWHTTLGPIHCDFDFLFNLKQQEITEHNGPHMVYFRYTFTPSADVIGGEVQLRLKIESHVEKLAVWLNGHEVEMNEEQKRNRRTGRYLSQTSSLGLFMKKGENVIAVSVTLPIAEGKAVLNLRLDRIPETEHLPGGVEAEAKMVTEKAVVCDLCTSLTSKDPACVAQCPHDAAFRIDPLYEPKRLVSSKS